MRIRLSHALAALTVAVGALGATQSGAMRPVATPDRGGPVKPVGMPAGVNKGTVNVVLQLDGDPVAVQQANAGRKLSKSEKDVIKDQLKGSQAQLKAPIASLGGKVIGEYQASYNGLKVNIARDKVAELATLPGVKAVRTLQLMKPDNTRAVPAIGVPGAWQSLGIHGEGIKIAIIDTGIDYTHANFGGPGTAAAYAAAHAAETAPANPAYFGPAAPRIKGGTDLVGDSYNADPNDPAYQPVPHPDPNPIDCDGHGSHVAGSAAGSGVLSTGATYAGAYNATTISSNTWNVGPGVAPKADIYAIRVFGCNGSTDVTVDAIEWAVDHDMDVINMSLGSVFGTNDDPAAEASTNAAKAGVIVVASAGNEGPSPYIVGSPAVADGAIAVAANDVNDFLPGASLLLSGTGQTVVAQNSNGAAFANGTVYGIAVLRTSYPSGPVALGCEQSDYTSFPGSPASLVGKMIVSRRGTCARVARAIFAQQHGGAAALMINTDTSYPPFEGPITSNPDTGEHFTVTIPFFGVKGVLGTGSDGDTIVANAGATATATNTTIANPNFNGFASFSSGGPRTGDSFLKPDITAPGVSVLSTGSGTGNLGAVISGTSMASPMVAGSAVLARQAHPTWEVADVKAALVNTGLPSGVVGYQTSRGGTGLVQPAKAAASQVVAHGDGGGKFSVALNFGFADLKGDFSQKGQIELENNGSSDATFLVSQASPSGRPHTVSFKNTTVKVKAHDRTQVEVTLNVPAATAGSAAAFREVAGLVQFTPKTATDNANVTLRVPYYFVPRARADVATDLGKLPKGATNPSATATVTNKHGVRAGDADFYAWGLDGNSGDKSTAAIRAVGAQSFAAADVIGGDALPDESFIVFAVNTFNRWSNASTNEFDISVDVDGDGVDDYVVIGVDDGFVNAGDYNGLMGTFVFSLNSTEVSEFFFATAPTDGSTAELALLSRQLCMDAAHCLSKGTHPRLTYHAVSFDILDGSTHSVPGTAKFNPWTNAVSTGGFASVAPGGTDTSVGITVNSAEWALTPAKGLMVVTLDNEAGPREAQLIEVKPK